MRITAIIPAYNEEKTIVGVVSVVKDHQLIDNTIVVSDGSSDDTAKLAREAGAKVVELEENQGKGAAMQAGIDKTSSDIILFLDADLLGLRPHHINDLLLPVINGEVETTIGIFTEGRVATDLAQKITPFLSGQRAVKRSILEDISNLNMTRYGVEVALTQYINNNDIDIKKIELEDLSHMMKEEKLGVIKGFKERIKMYWEVLKNLPKKTKTK